jgi:hypothetical protein
VIARARAVASSASAREAERCDAGEAEEGGGQASPAARARSGARAACEGAAEEESEERVSAAHPMAAVASCSTSALAMRARGASRRWRAPGLRLQETHVTARQQLGACVAPRCLARRTGAELLRNAVWKAPGAWRRSAPRCIPHDARAPRTGCRANARTSRRKH